MGIGTILITLFSLASVYTLLLLFMGYISSVFFAIGKMYGYFDVWATWISINLFPLEPWVFVVYSSLPIVYLFVKIIQYFTKKNH